MNVLCTVHNVYEFYKVLGKENRISVREELSRKKCKTGILLYCSHTAGVLHIFALYNLFIENLKLKLKENHIMK